jgi:hypothetical protein
VKYLAALLLIPTVALSQLTSQEVGEGDALCPLSDSQTEKSIEAFAKIFPVLTQEPRCVNCHGAVNPFIDGVGDPSDPAASRVEHEGGKMDDATEASPGTDCSSCHSSMAAKRDGSPSTWAVPPPQLFFIGKDAPALCIQLHQELSRPGDLAGHFQDDRGEDNFIGTAFLGMRGVSAEQFPEVAPRPPRGISRGGLVALANDWLATTGGEFQGDLTRACGCKPLHYAVRLSVVNALATGPLQMTSAMEPTDIPITFADDGTFVGEGAVDFTGQGTVTTAVASCTAQYSSRLQIRASGHVRNDASGQDMSLKLQDLGPAVNSVSAQCPRGGFTRPNVQDATPRTVLDFELVGNVGEVLNYRMPGTGISSQLRIELVQLTEPTN